MERQDSARESARRAVRDRSTASRGPTATARPLRSEAAEYLKWKHPHSEVVVTDLASGKATAVSYKSEPAPR